MPWTEITRPQHQRATRRYASELTDDEWTLLTPFMAEPARLGRPRTTDLRNVVDALLSMAPTGCRWRQLSRDFPPYSTVQGCFYRWAKDGTLPRINHALVMAALEAAGRGASPTAGVIDSQSVNTTEAGGPRGGDAGKKVKGRKRHIVTDTLGHLVGWLVHPADVQDRDGAAKTLATIPKPVSVAATRLRRRRLRRRQTEGRIGRTGPMEHRGSSSAPTRPKDLRCCLGAGSSNAPLPGSGGAAGSPRISRQRSPAPPPGC